MLNLCYHRNIYLKNTKEEISGMTYIYYYKSPMGDMTEFSNGSALTALHFNGQKYASRMMRGEYEEKMLPVFEQTK